MSFATYLCCHPYLLIKSILVSLNESNDKLRDELKAKALENQELQHQIETSRNQIICNYEVRL